MEHAACLSDGIGDKFISSNHPGDIETDGEERRKQGSSRLCRPALRHYTPQWKCYEDYGLRLDNLPADRLAT